MRESFSVCLRCSCAHEKEREREGGRLLDSNERLGSDYDDFPQRNLPILNFKFELNSEMFCLE